MDQEQNQEGVLYENNNHNLIKVVVILLFSLSVLFALWYVYSNYLVQDISEENLQNGESDGNFEGALEDEVEQVYWSAREARDRNDHLTAARLFEESSELRVDGGSKVRELIRASAAYFMTDDLSLQSKGIDLLKDTIRNADQYPADQAWGIQMLAQMVCGSGCSSSIYEIVFSGDSFSEHKVENDIAASVANLYKWSLSIQPHYDAYIRLMAWHSEQLLLNSHSLTESEIEEHRTAILRYGEESDVLFYENLADVGTKIQVSYNFWKGYSYAGLAYLDEAKYGLAFEKAYKNAILLGEGGDPNTSIADPLAFAYYQYAALLHYIYGDQRMEDVHSNLKKLETLVRADETPLDNQFLLMVRNEIREDGFQHGLVGQSIYTLADTYHDFNVFLMDYGLNVLDI